MTAQTAPTTRRVQTLTLDMSRPVSTVDTPAAPVETDRRCLPGRRVLRGGGGRPRSRAHRCAR